MSSLVKSRQGAEVLPPAVTDECQNSASVPAAGQTAWLNNIGNARSAPKQPSGGVLSQTLSLMHASSCLKEQLSKLGAQPGTQQPSGGPHSLSLGYCQPPIQCCHAKPCTCVYPSTCLQENVVLSLIAEDQGDLGLVLRVAQDVASHLQHGCHPAAAAHLQPAALSSLAEECVAASWRDLLLLCTAATGAGMHDQGSWRVVVCSCASAAIGAGQSGSSRC